MSAAGFPNDRPETLAEYFTRISHIGPTNDHERWTEGLGVGVAELPCPEWIARSPGNLEEFATHFDLEGWCGLEELIPCELRRYEQQIIDAAEDAIAAAGVIGMKKTESSLRFIAELYRGSGIPIKWGPCATAALL
ncbi:MAG TPA: hypothetical protein VN673_17570 [Clostridia bacterium]|nr:hypothetical protein [Clostridia bacterium]